MGQLSDEYVDELFHAMATPERTRGRATLLPPAPPLSPPKVATLSDRVTLSRRQSFPLVRGAAEGVDTVGRVGVVDSVEAH